MEVIGSFKVPAEDPEEIEAETADAMAQLADLAKPFGVRLALEYMGVPASSVKTFSQALSIVRKAGRENAGLLVDTWHHYAGGGTVEELKLAGGKEIFMVHVSDCPERKPFSAVRTECFLPGDGVIPIKEMLQSLGETGYEGPVSAEVMAPEIRHLAPTEYIRRTKMSVVPLLPMR